MWGSSSVASCWCLGDGRLASGVKALGVEFKRAHRGKAGFPTWPLLVIVPGSQLLQTNSTFTSKLGDRLHQLVVSLKLRRQFAKHVQTMISNPCPIPRLQPVLSQPERSKLRGMVLLEGVSTFLSDNNPSSDALALYMEDRCGVTSARLSPKNSYVYPHSDVTGPGPVDVVGAGACRNRAA